MSGDARGLGKRLPAVVAFGQGGPRAFLDGRASLDEATLRIAAGDRGHDVVGSGRWNRRRRPAGCPCALPGA